MCFDVRKVSETKRNNMKEASRDLSATCQPKTPADILMHQIIRVPVFLFGLSFFSIPPCFFFSFGVRIYRLVFHIRSYYMYKRRRTVECHDVSLWVSLSLSIPKLEKQNEMARIRKCTCLLQPIQSWSGTRFPNRNARTGFVTWKVVCLFLFVFLKC